MRKLIYGVLLAAVGFGAVSAGIHTNKTFLMPRSHNENMAMEYTTWHKTVRAIDESGDKFGADIQAVPFYQKSENDTALGKYFGMYNNANGLTPNVNKTTWNPYSGNVQDFIWTRNRTDAPGGPTGNLSRHYQALLLDTRFIFHGATAPFLNVQGLLRPDSESYGVRLDYHQSLDKVTKGLYLKVTAPIVEVKNNMNIRYTSTSNETTQVVTGVSGTSTLDDYLSGRYENTSAANRQYKLTHAKIAGSDSTSGVADIDVTLGYNFLYREDKHCGVNVCMTIPTGGSPNGDRLFEAVVGNGGHFGLGVGVDSAFELWKSKSRSLEMLLAANYKYLFDSTEVRTLNIKFSYIAPALDTYNLSNKIVGHGFYLLGAKVGTTGAFPLANVLTREVGVHPGSMFEGLASFCLNWGKFSWDLGYNLFAKEGESIMVKNWPNSTYGIPLPGSDVDGAFNIASSWWGDTGEGLSSHIDDDYINLTNLVAPASPVYVTHKIFTGVGATFDWKFPVMFGIGGSWEWAQGSNSALDGWALWGKAGISF